MITMLIILLATAAALVFVGGVVGISSWMMIKTIKMFTDNRRTVVK